jgi:hypothetical protein
VVRRDAVDGIHFDYIRYPETDNALPRGSNVGYNPVSVRRFQRATGRSDVPGPSDEQWTAWRRRQVTDLVRRISIEARSIKPAIVVTAASIAWGRPPETLADFSSAAPMQRIFQNWQAWLAEGLLDLACPMNYAREHDPRVREWFNGWVAWEKRHKADRRLIVGIGGYLNTAENVLAQMARARTKDGRRTADGTSIFSYFRPAALSLATGPELPGGAEAAAPDRFDFLVKGAGSAGAAYRGPAPVPPMPGIERPATGMLAGSITGIDERPVRGATIQLRRTGWFRSTVRLVSDGNGWFGRTSLKPGTDRVRLELAGGKAAAMSVTVDVQAGRVARVSLGAAGAPHPAASGARPGSGGTGP